MALKYTSFNAVTVSLESSNLIEASAGTGKTYSLAMLTLRLVLSGKAAIQQILMVTFTKAAVAELEIRVRSFIRKARLAAQNQPTQIEEEIFLLVNEAIKEYGLEKVVQRLKEAELMLDQTSIMTIHGFCQKSLLEYAFETGQLFSAQTLEPDEYDTIVTDAFNDIWRNEITTIPVDLLSPLLSSGLSYNNMLSKVSQALSGHSIYCREAIPDAFLTSSYFDKERTERDRQQNEMDLIDKELVEYIQEYNEELRIYFTEHETDEETIEAFDRGEYLFTVSFFASIADSLKEPHLPLKELLAVKQRLAEEQRLTLCTRILQMTIYAFQKVKREVDHEFQKRGCITFDEMITRLHYAVCIQLHPGLLHHLREKYKAVFVDEFQDTDRLQYELFSTLYEERTNEDSKGTCLFYIGDPKQLIYGWRKADLNTYFKATHSVKRKFSMKTNFRSHPDLVEAMNYFFQPDPAVNYFHFDSKDVNCIEYEIVEAKTPSTKERLIANKEIPTPIQVMKCKNIPQRYQGTAALVRELLNKEKYQLSKGDSTRAVCPADIGIIVRTNEEALAIKNCLSALRIPSVTIQESRILQSQEATDIYYFLKAALSLTRSEINRALMSGIGGWSVSMLTTSTEEQILERFRQYLNGWKEKGIYLMLRQWLSDSKVVARLRQTGSSLSERAVANSYQLVELLHAIEQKKSYSPEEIVQWLKKGIDGEIKGGDAYEQRLESDAAAVNIVTVHKSKGLDYNIVILPNMDLAPSTKREEVRFRGEDGIYYTAEKEMISIAEHELYRRQEEQENKRLLYVAVTRACCHCFLFSKPISAAKTKSNDLESATILQKTLAFMRSDQMQQRGISYMDIPVYDLSNPYLGDGVKRSPVYSPVPEMNLPDSYWRKTSYSSLKQEGTPSSQEYLEATTAQTDYDRFVFHELTRGAHVGIMLHTILEKIDFTMPNRWQITIERTVQSYFPTADKKMMEQIELMMMHVLNAKISTVSQSFSLSAVSWDERLNELEFDLPLKLFNTNVVLALSSMLRVRSNLNIEGIMNGKIDLFFRHNHQYFILDWKSNYLGASAQDYVSGKLKISMEEKMYMLQYHLYTLAVYRYLNQRVPSFSYERDFGGVIYVYLRGARSGEKTGIYIDKPEYALIKEMESVLLKDKIPV